MIAAFPRSGALTVGHLLLEPAMPLAPIARVEPGTDPYRWLENRDSAEVLDHLKAENAYVEAELADQAALREQLEVARAALKPDGPARLEGEGDRTP